MTSTSNTLHWTSSCECVSFQLVRCPTPRVPWRSPRCVRRVRLGRSCWSGRTASSWTTAPTGRSSSGKVHIQYIVRMLLDKGRRTHCSPCRASIRKRSKCWGEAVGPEDGRQIHRSDELSQDENSGLSPSERSDLSLTPLRCYCDLLVLTVLQVEILPQGKETIIFKQFFKNWN